MNFFKFWMLAILLGWVVAQKGKPWYVEAVGYEPIAFHEDIDLEKGVFIFDKCIKSKGRLFGFSLYFISMKPIKLLLIRPYFQNHEIESYKVIHSWIIYPKKLGLMDIKISDIYQECVQVKIEDRIGLYIDGDELSISHQYDYSATNHMILLKNKQLKMNHEYKYDNIEYPCIFSIQAYIDRVNKHVTIDEYTKCPLVDIPNEFLEEKPYASVGYEAVILHEPIALKRSIFIFEEPIQAYGHIYAFSFYFISLNSIEVVLLRPKFVDSKVESFKLLEKWMIHPTKLGLDNIIIADIKQNCMFVRGGDRIGFIVSSDGEYPSISHQYVYSAASSIVQVPSSSFKIGTNYKTDKKSYPCIFSFEAIINKDVEVSKESYTNCPTLAEIPDEYSQKRKTDEMGYDLLTYNEPVKWNVSLFIFDEPFTSFGDIYAFSFFFNNTDPLKVLLFRPNFVKSKIKSYKLINIWDIQPEYAGLQHISISDIGQQCVNIRKDDRLGIYIDDNDQSVAHQYDYNLENIIVQMEGKDLVIGQDYVGDGKGYHCKFSFKAYIDNEKDTYQLDKKSQCPVSVVIPSVYEKNSNDIYEQVGYDQVSLDEFVHWNKSSFLFANAVKSEGRIFAFSFYFINTEPVEIGLWRPQFDENNVNAFQLMHVWNIFPGHIGVADVMIKDINQDCIDVKPNDHLGYFLNGSFHTIAHQYDYNTENIIIQSLDGEGFNVGQVYESDGKGYPCILSVKALIIKSNYGDVNAYSNCPSNTEVPRMYKAAFKKRDILGSNPIALNEPVKWNTSIFLIDDVKSFGRIYGFSFFFINLNPIKLILMRPDYTSNIPETFTLVYTWLIYPNNLGREDVMVQDISQICEIARPGDKIGLYLKDQSPAVAHQYDYRVKNRIIQNVYQNDLIINKAYSTDGIKYPCVFSIRFYMDQDFGYTKIDNYSKCPINSGVPLLYSTEEKYETIGYDLVSIDEYSPWQLSIFLFVDPIESFGYLYGFSMYFVSKDPVTLCLLRPNYAYSTIYSYKLVQKWTINPENLGKSHIMISAINQQCFMVRKGDQIGILIDDDSPSIAHQYNDAIRNNIIPLDSEELEINRDYNTDGLQYNCIFSLKIHINKEFENLDEYSNCSDENKNPKEIEKEENTGEEVGYNLISFDEPVKWNVSSFIFEDGFMSYGRIFGFTFYFIKMDPVKVLLWRPTYENFEILSYKLIHIWTITPPNLGLVDIHLQENSRCISTKPNDRLGIFIDDNTPSIAHQYDYNVGNSIIQNIDENDLIVGNEYTTDGVGYPCIFSMKAYSDKLIREGKIDQTSDCPIDITIPKQKEKSENAGRFEQVGYKPLSKHESVNWNISAFIFAQDIQRKGRLFAFTFYFLNTDPLKVLLFRPKYYNGQIETYNLIHIWDIIPPQTGLVNIGLEDIKQQCVECKVNDRIGIYINDDSPAVTHQYDYNIKNVIIQNVYESDLVIGQEYTSDGMGYPCVFSVQGYICTEDTETSLYNCPAIDNLYEAFESAKYYTNGFDLLKSNQIAVREKCAVAFSKCINSSGILFSFSMYLINTNPIKLLLWRPSIVNHVIVSYLLIHVWNIQPTSVGFNEFLISDLNQECVFVEYEDRLGIYLEDNPLAIAEQINENVVNDMVSMEDVEINKVYYPEGVTKYTFSLQAHIDIDLSESNLDKYSNCLGSKFKGIETKDMKEIPLPLIIGVLQKFMDWLTNQ